VSVDLAIDHGVALPTAMPRRLRTELARMVVAAARFDRRAAYEVSLRLVGDATIRVLNRDYRGKDRPTDVLAFAQRDAGVGPPPEPLGDVVISVDTARRQARRGLYRELLHLASHGLCHLLGYDHRDDAEERTMNARAAALRAEASRRGRIRAA
jgi:probable rRNA maturation factor